MLSDDMYERQTPLSLEIPPSATVLGCGGVGFWVGLDLAMIGVKEITLIDKDTIEPHNLNRCGWSQDQIGENKAIATAQKIMTVRPGCTIHPISEHIENCAPFKNLLFSPLFDNRDSIAPLPPFCPDPLITGGYDGLNCTLHFHPKTPPFGDESTEVTYRITPSFIVPAQILAAYKVLFAVSPNRCEKEKVINIDLEEVIK